MSFQGTCLSMGICDDLTGDASHVGHCTGDDGSGGEGTEKLGLSSQGSSIELSNKQRRVLRENKITLSGQQNGQTASYNGRIDGESRRLEGRHRNVGRRNRSGDGGGLGRSRLSGGGLRSGHLWWLRGHLLRGCLQRLYGSRLWLEHCLHCCS